MEAQMKVITIQQPYASLLMGSWKRDRQIVPFKNIETRSWIINYRGDIAIHAAKNFPDDCKHLCLENGMFRNAIKVLGYTVDTLPRGCILGFRRLVEIHSTEKVIPVLSRTERAFGDYTEGRYGWIFDQAPPVLFKTPIPTRGYQGLWEYDGG